MEFQPLQCKSIGNSRPRVQDPVSRFPGPRPKVTFVSHLFHINFTLFSHMCSHFFHIFRTLSKVSRTKPTYFPPGADTSRGGAGSTQQSGSPGMGNPTPAEDRTQGPGPERQTGPQRPGPRWQTGCRDTEPVGRQEAGSRTRATDRIQRSGPGRQTRTKDPDLSDRKDTGTRTQVADRT